MRNGAIISVATGGDSITTFAESAAIHVSSHTVPPSASAGNTRASGKLHKKGVAFADNTLCGRRYAGREGLSVAGCGLSITSKKARITYPKAQGAVDCHFDGQPRPLFCVFPLCR